MAKTPAGSQPFKFHTIDDVANMLEVSTRTVRRWISKGDLIVHKIGNLVRIAESDLESFIAHHQAP